MPTELPDGVREVAAAGALAPRARSGPSPLLTITDEEMLVLYGNVGEAQYASPWLDRLAVDRGKEFDVGMLMATARRSMVARGMIAPEVILAAAEKRAVSGDPKRFSANLLITGVLTRRNHAAVRVEAFSHVPEERGAHHVFVDHDGTVLHEQTSADGLHHFAVQRVPDSIDLLRSFVLCRDPDQIDASTTKDDARPEIAWRGSVGTASSDPALLEHTGDLLAETRLSLSGKGSGEHGMIHLVSGQEALVILQPSPDDSGDDDMSTARRITTAELGEILEELLVMDDEGFADREGC